MPTPQEQADAIQRAAALRNRTVRPTGGYSVYAGGGMASPQGPATTPAAIVNSPTPPPAAKPAAKPKPAVKPAVKKPATPVAKTAAKKVVLPKGIDFAALKRMDDAKKIAALPKGIDFAALRRMNGGK